MQLPTRSLDDIVAAITPPSRDWLEKARERTAQLVMPQRALGRLHEIAEQVCAMRRSLAPSVERKAILVLAGDHGVAREGSSAYPQEVTGAMVRTFLAGGAGINAIGRHVGAVIRVADLGIVPDLDPAGLPGGEALRVCKIRRGTDSFTRGPAMGRDEAERSILTGFALAEELYAQGFELLGTGEMGIGNSAASAAIGAVLTGAAPEAVVGRGTGLDDEGLERKRQIVRRAIAVNKPSAADGLDVLSKLGGFEIGGIAGCILACACHQRPVMIDGFIATAGALIAHAICPASVAYALAGHCSQEPGHRIMLEFLGLPPLLDLGMRLGEGTGGALAMGLVDAAVRIFKEVATFAEAGVAGKS